MTQSTQPSEYPLDVDYPDRPEGPVSATIIAAGIGALAMGVVTVLAEADAGIKEDLTFDDDVGPLSGKTIVAVAVWLVAWVILLLAMRRVQFETWRAFIFALVLIALGVVGTFPTFFQEFADE